MSKITEEESARLVQQYMHELEDVNERLFDVSELPGKEVYYDEDGDIVAIILLNGSSSTFIFNGFNHLYEVANGRVLDYAEGVNVYEQLITD